MDPYFTSNECYMQYMRSIEETLTRMYYAVDARQFDLLKTRVFAPQITPDYTSMFGGEPQTRTAEEQTENWRQLMTRDMEATQHVITGFLPLDMDWPNGVTSLDRDFVTVHYYVNAYLRKRTDDGRVLETRNGGRGEALMQRMSVPGQSSKAFEWRVRKFKALAIWDQDGKSFWGSSDSTS